MEYGLKFMESLTWNKGEARGRYRHEADGLGEFLEDVEDEDDDTAEETQPQEPSRRLAHLLDHLDRVWKDKNPCYNPPQLGYRLDHNGL